jgi:glutamyl-tRNA(Gln) amidotransferase subunit E
MEKTDYKKIGLKCGIEIHQQLDGSKLFCRCPTNITDGHEFSLIRRLRSVSGELGKRDIATIKEAAKGKYYEYSGSEDNSCLVDFDESPPLPLSSDALYTALQMSKLLSTTVVDAVQVMRKLVIDGSNTAGFQRTALIGMDGVLDSSLGKVRIPTVIVEEDSAQKRGQSAEHVEYNLDRLGIPLIEIATHPDIKTPAHCKEVAQKLGMLLRSTGRVKRGLGTIRQDVNVSIKGGTRVEIKGAQDLKLVPTLVNQEILRQQSLIKLKAEFKVRKVSTKPVQDLTPLLKSCESKVIRSAVDTGGVVLAIKVSGASGLLGMPIQEGRRLGTELSNYAKVQAGIKGLFHSDELPKYGITQDDVNRIIKKLGCKKNDAFILIAESTHRATMAMDAVVSRLEKVTKGVLPEVRNARADGTSEYLRPLPGPARMYPETDIETIVIDKKMLKDIKLPELIDDRAVRYEKLGLGKDLAALAAKSARSPFFDTAVKSFSQLKPSYIAEILLTSAKTLKAKGIEITPNTEDFMTLFDALAHSKISKESVLKILSEQKPIKSIIAQYYMLSDAAIEKKVKELMKKYGDLPFNALIGKIMNDLRGQAPGKKVMDILKSMVKK